MLLARLGLLMPNSYVDYLLRWIGGNRQDTLYFIMESPGMHKFVNHLISMKVIDEYLSAILGANLSHHILTVSNYTFDINNNVQFLNKFVFTKKEAYQYEFQYSKKYKCPRCSAPCDYQDIQIRRGDEDSNLILFCTNCNLQIRK